MKPLFTNIWAKPRAVPPEERAVLFTSVRRRHIGRWRGRLESAGCPALPGVPEDAPPFARPRDPLVPAQNGQHAPTPSHLRLRSCHLYLPDCLPQIFREPSFHPLARLRPLASPTSFRPSPASRAPGELYQRGLSRAHARGRSTLHQITSICSPAAIMTNGVTLSDYVRDGRRRTAPSKACSARIAVAQSRRRPVCQAASAPCAHPAGTRTNIDVLAHTSFPLRAAPLLARKTLGPSIGSSPALTAAPHLHLQPRYAISTDRHQRAGSPMQMPGVRRQISPPQCRRRRGGRFVVAESRPWLPARLSDV